MPRLTTFLTIFGRRLLPACAAFSALLGSTALAAKPAKTALNPAGFAIHRGTNLSHWLSQDFGWSPRAQLITENDFRFIKHAGFDHVRLPVDEKELWQEDGKPNEEAFQLLLRAIGWARGHGLRVIVDLHTVKTHHFNAANEGRTNTLWTDPAAQAHFLLLWDELSSRLHTLPVADVAYEILNEPVAEEHADWNKLVAAALKQLRAAEPNRVIVIGSNRWQSPATLPFLAVPAGDKNIILSMHSYSPLMFTHYRADWTPLKTYTGPVHYPGPVIERDAHARILAATPQAADLIGDALDVWNADRIRVGFEPAIRRARELGLQLFCGEFGCLPTVPRAERLAYYRDFISVLESEHIAWANWEYKGDFGLFEWHGTTYQGGAPDVELLDILLQR